MRTFIDKIRNIVLRVCCLKRIEKQQTTQYNLRSNGIGTWLIRFSMGIEIVLHCARLAVACPNPAGRKHHTITNAIYLFTFHCFCKVDWRSKLGLDDKNRARRSCQSEQHRFSISIADIEPGVTCKSESTEQQQTNNIIYYCIATQNHTKMGHLPVSKYRRLAHETN